MATSTMEDRIARWIGERVHELREERARADGERRSREWLSRQIEMSRQTVEQIEHGRQIPTPRTLERLAKALRVEVSDLWPPPEVVAGKGARTKGRKRSGVLIPQAA